METNLDLTSALPFNEMLTFIYLAAALLLYMYKVLKKEIKTGEDKLLFSLYCICTLIYSLVIDKPLSYWMGFLCALIYTVTADKKRAAKSFLIGFLSFLIIVFRYGENFWNVPSLLMTVAAFSLLAYITSSLLGDKIAGMLLPLTVAFRIASAICIQYRYSYLTVGYIMSLGTALNVAPEYNIKFGQADLIISAFSFIVLILWFVFIKNEKKNIKRALVAFMAFALLNIPLAIRAEKYVNADRSVHFNNFYEGFMLSVVNEIKTNFIFYDEAEERTLVENFTSDNKNYQQPNIVGILCESYADVCDAFGVTPSRDPLKKYKKLEKEGCRTGYVTVDTIGGGTANSEWEFLTGLDIKNLSGLQTPFTNKCNINYAFTADALYDDYNKAVIHPYKEDGHNRKHVYTAFEYDERHFIEDTDFFDDYELIRNLVTDKSLYEKLEEMLQRDEPQYITAITMQNHGDYDSFELDDPIRVNDDFPEKKRLENYLTLIEHSSEDLYDFIDWIKKHPEEPTIVIFFGDHFPGRIVKEDNAEFYKTPYLVYSNFSKLSEIPEETDLSLLYPYAKKAAGMPLTAYEKYLLSLNGETPDANFIKCRIENGYF